MAPSKPPSSVATGAAPAATSANPLKGGATKESTHTVSVSTTNTSSAPSPLTHTPVGQIAGIVDKLRDSFHTKQKTHPIQFRLNQLRNLYFAIKDNTDALSEALFKDFRRVREETKNLEINVALNEIVHTMANLHKWSKPDKITGLPLTMSTNPAIIEKIPLGVVLIISPFNYPLLLSLSAVVGAISAGNCVVLKQSEMTPHFTELFSEVLTKALDPDIFAVVNGAIPETTEVLNQKFDKIMYTGNNAVGTIVAKKAAETLTPVVLELGGKSPAIVLEDLADKEVATVANRIVWGRFTNCGQTCVAVDYVLVHESKKELLLKEIKRAIETKFYPGVTKDDPSYTHLIHDRAFQNLSDKLDKTKGKILLGNDRDAASRYISPTVIYDVGFDDSTMSQELFGPILPVITYKNITDATAQVVRYHDTPLAQYIFTSNTNRDTNWQVDTILKTIRSGAVMVNDVILHVGLVNAPFGGIGQSGHGAYHGVYSYRTFTHERTTMEVALWKENAVSARYPPFNKPKQALIETSMGFHGGRVWFGRTGDVSLDGPSKIWSFYSGLAGVAALGYCLYAAS